MRNKVVLITGASSGIGKALAEAFATAGARLVLGARTLSALEALKPGLLQRGSPAVHVVQMDVTVEADCARFAAEAVQHMGGIDVFIANAGIGMYAPFADCDVSTLRQVMEVNLWGVVNCTKYALPHLLKSRGSLVAVSSIAGRVGLPWGSGYSASKFALEGFCNVIRTEHLHLGLHVLVAMPGFTTSNIRNRHLGAHGEIIPTGGRKVKGEMPAEVCAQHILHATIARKRTLVLTHQGILGVLLAKWLPGVLDRSVNKRFMKKS